MLIGIDRVMHVVQERGDRLADARAVRAVPHAARHARDQRALDLFLQIEHGRVFVASQRVAERRDFAPRRRDEGTMPPVAHRDRNDAPQAGMKLQQRDESAFGDPVDRELGPVRADVGDDGQRMDDVTERRGAHDEDGARRCIARALGWSTCRAARSRTRVAPIGAARSRGVRHRSICSQDSGETS